MGKFLVIFMLISSSLTAKEAFYALLISDTSSKEMADLHNADVKRVESFLVGFCKNSNQKLIIKKVHAKNLSKKKIEKFVPKESKIKHNMFIYYSGNHPFFHCVEDIDANLSNKIITPEFINTTILKKNRNLLFTVVFDCYQNIYPDKNIEADYLKIRWNKKTARNLKNLFCKYEGTSLIASSLGGESAYGMRCKNMKGGIFTAIFVDIASRLKKSVNWYEFLGTIENTYRRFPDFSEESGEIPKVENNVYYNLVNTRHENEEIFRK